MTLNNIRTSNPKPNKSILTASKRELMIMQAVVKWGTDSKIDFQTTALKNGSTPISDLLSTISDLMYEVESAYISHYEGQSK